MNIWLPIIVNLFIASFLVVGAFIGRKNGWKYELIKLLTMCAFGVGIYFLSPIISALTLKISFINNLVFNGLITMSIINSIVIVLLFSLIYLLVSLVFRAIRNSGDKRHTSNRAKVAKIKGINREETRKLRKEQRKFRKEQRLQAIKLRREKASKTSKVFGIIFGIIFGIVFGFVVTLPLKPIFRHVADNQPAIEEIVKGYEYTPYGQLDKVTNIVNKVIGE